MKRLLACSSLCLLLAAGCQPAPTTTGAGDPRDPATTAEPEKAAQGGKVDVQVASWDETQQMIARQNGKVVVVDLWTTW